MSEPTVWDLPEGLSRDVVSKISNDVFHKEPTKVSGVQLTERVGFMAHIYRLKLLFGDMESGVEIALKLPSIDIINKEWVKSASGDADAKPPVALHNLIDVHNAECNAYQFLTSQPSKLPVAHCFGSAPMSISNTPGYLVLEDLGSTGMVVDLLEGLNLQQIISVARSLGQFQAHFLLDQSWRKSFKRLDKSMWEVVITSIIDCNAGNRALFPNIWTLEDSDLIRLFNLDQFWSATDPDSGSFVPVLCHGDLWCNNLMFKQSRTDSKEATNDLLAVVDWQVAHPGKCMEDLARLLCSSCSTDVRRNHFETILEAYYQELKDNVPSDYRLPFTLAEARECYREMLPHGSVMMVMQLAVQMNGPYQTESQAKKDAFAQRMKDAMDDALATLDS